MILDSPSDRKMVEILVSHAFQAKHFMGGIVEETTDPCTANVHGFSLQVKDLAYHAAFPEEARIEPWTIPAERVFELGDHSGAEAAVACNVLEAGELR
jgi:hypothetical protein